MDASPPFLYSAEQVRELDRRAIEVHGIAGYELMQRAARACWQQIVQRWPDAGALCVVCGRGNNGGDGYEIARLARTAGWRVSVVAPYGAPANGGDAERAHAAWLAEGGDTLPAGFDTSLPSQAVWVDALFGTGLQPRHDPLAADVICAINAARSRGAKVLAVDVPSGLDASSGSVMDGRCVQADLTVSFIGRKFGLYSGQGPQWGGECCFDDLALPATLYEGMKPLARLQRRGDLRAALPRRARTAHKGDHGHVAVIGGNHGMAGAALMSSRAALRAGAGLVSVITQREHAPIFTVAQPEVMCRSSDHPAAVRDLLSRVDVIAIGPGLGTDAWAQAMFSLALDAGKPLILDADALNLLALEPVTLRDAILTPHPGEAARLLGGRTSDVQRDRAAALVALERRYEAAIVLKGAGTLVSGDPLPVCCPYGNPGMAVGGMGDALTGIVAALRAQGLDAACAAQTGVLVHALAGDIAAASGERGTLPSDLIDAVREVVNP